MPPLSSELSLTTDFDPEYLEYYQIFPLELNGDRLAVAAASKPDADVLADLERSFGASVELTTVDEEEIVEAIRRTFGTVESPDSLFADILDDGGPFEDDSDGLEADVRDLANQPPVVRFVNLTIGEAHSARASDVHVEATPAGLTVRYRIDGVLTPAHAPPGNLRAAVVSRLKLIANLDIAERRLPQDGRSRLRLGDRDVDLRVSTIPTLHGESVVLRLLDHGDGPSGLDGLGMDDKIQSSFAQLARRPHGIVLATGPTGSGKTTTLYSALQLRDPATEKIITVEDPVEYRLTDITQVPVNARAGMTFAAGLRAILRQDPDVVMVGEIRDAETANIAIQAAMTGHLVFSTVHTNDAASAVMRLVDLGVEPYLVAATLQGVLAQRLVRTFCLECVETRRPSTSDWAFLGDTPVELPFAVGCPACRQSGYSGRTGLYELLTLDGRVQDELIRTQDAGRIRKLAVTGGMKTLREDGVAKALAGITSVEEVLRATHV